MFSPLVSGNTELPDPTRPANYVVDDEEPIFFEEIETREKISLKLSAIRISASDKSAIVNGKLVRIGDEIDTATIIEINRLSVVVSHEDKKIIVRLYNKQFVKDYKPSK
jgi:hypothetical protein